MHVLHRLFQNSDTRVGEKLLIYYVKQWNIYQSQTAAMDELLKALNKQWVSRMLVDNVAGVQQVLHVNLLARYVSH